MVTGYRHLLDGHGEVVAELRARIHDHGPITFAEFMSVALYWPHGGYYAAAAHLGPDGDFYTAPLTHPVFGALIARQLAHVWHALGRPSPFWVAEAAAGTGRLAADVVAHAPLVDQRFAESLRYVAIDVSAPVSAHGRAGAWLRAGGLPLRSLRGCIIANELLDALPVHRVTVRGGRLLELFVTLDERGAFAEVEGEPSTPALAERLAGLGIELPEGYRTEINLAMEEWLREASAALDEGLVLLFDYGHEADAYYDASRDRGTLRCYHRHTLNANPYVMVGRQDISVHVELTTLRRAAEAAGFRPVGQTSQAAFLRGLGLAGYRDDIAQRRDLTPFTRRANLRALDDLVDPEGMGDFKAVAFGKGAWEPDLDGFKPDPAGSQKKNGSGARALLAQGLAPLATPGHMVPEGVEEPAALPTWDELTR